ncbi:MAG: AAA family ATPase [Thermodesulfobacteriota bacterium]|nr:AAA family ATPase [Thermodesulfobacteriota bacterium]
MQYYDLLNLTHEPFSNAPDPDFFFPSFVHHECIQKIELAVRLKRGLNVVCGCVGTGKTTICRALIRRFTNDEQIRPYLFLDPVFTSAPRFLARLLETFTGTDAGDMDEAAMKERLKQYLFETCVEGDITPVVIIDEGQKLPGFALEILRELLNYETNDNKLLQILIFAQPEFETVLRQKENVRDRINLFYRLTPLSRLETIQFIRFRINKASVGKPAVSFSLPALWRIHTLTGGYPRKIINLSHQAILALIIQNKTKITRSLVNVSAERSSGMVSRPAPIRSASIRPGPVSAIGIALIVAAGIFAMTRLDGTVNAEKKTASPDVPNRSATSTSDRTAGENPSSHDDEASPPAPENSPAGTTHSRQASFSAEEPGPDESTPVLTASAAPGAGGMDKPAKAKVPKDDTPTESDGTQPTSAAPQTLWPKYPKPLAVKTAAAPDAESMAGTADENEAASPPDAERQSAEPRQYLGIITVNQTDTLYDIIRFIYGDCTPAKIEALHRTNPHVNDPAVIEEGIVIKIPVLNRWRAPQTEGFWVSLGTYDGLDEAYTDFRTIHNVLPDTRMLTWTNAEQGRTCSIIIAKRYNSRSAAESRAAALDPAIARRSSVIADWGSNPIFYTPPWHITDD